MNEHVKSEISSYLAGGLTESRNRQIEAHAAACEKCRNAFSKARAKQARVKREALKKASSDPLPNLFLARQGKTAGADTPAAKKSWMAVGVILLAVAGYWAVRQHRLGAHTALAPEAAMESVETSSKTVVIPAAPPAIPATPVVVRPEPPKPIQALLIQQEWKGSDSGIKEARLVVIRSEEKWGKLWTEMQLKDPLPDINFSQHLIIGVFGGDRPSGSSIAFGKIQADDEEVDVPYRVSMPVVQVSTTTAAPARASPYLLSLIPRVDKKIRLFEKEASQ